MDVNQHIKILIYVNIDAYVYFWKKNQIIKLMFYDFERNEKVYLN